MADREVFAHTFCFQALSDEVDISVTDFESTRNQGYRLIDLLEDTMEGDVLRDRINTVQESLDRIQLLVSQKEKDVGDRYYHMAEFEVAFKDCEERVSDFKTRLQGVRTTDVSERHEKIQDLSIEIPFIRSLIEDLKERERNLVEFCSEEELEKIKADTSRLSEDFETLRQDALSNFNDPHIETPSLATEVVEASSINKEDSKTLADLNLVDNRAAASSRKTENGENPIDSDLDNESGVSSMESFESLLKRNEAHINDVESCDSEHPVKGSNMKRIGEEKGGISVSPSEYEEFLQNQSNTSNQDESPSAEESSSGHNVSKKISQVEVPLLIFTDENGEEVPYSVGANDDGEDSGDKPLTVTDENELSEDYDQDSEEDNVTNDDKNKESNERPLSDELDAVEHAQDVAPDTVKDADVDINNVQLQENQPTKEEREQVNDVPPVDLSDIELKNREEGLCEEILNEVHKPKATNETALSDSEDSGENAPCRVTETCEIKIESSSHESIINSLPAASSSKPKYFTDLGESREDSRESSNMDQRSEPIGASIDLESDSYLDFQSQLTDEQEGTLQTGQDLSGSISTPETYKQEQHSVSEEDVCRVRSPDIPTRHYSAGVPGDKENEANEPIYSIPRTFPGISNGDLDETGNKEPKEILDEIARRRHRVRPTNSPPQESISSYARDSTAYQSPYFGGAFSRLRELDEYEVPLEEGMSLDVFVVEVEKLLEKLRVIEDMMKACQCIDDNVKDELARHVALCVEMSRQQGRINVMNTLAEQFPFHKNSSLMIILDERLNAVNTLWEQLHKRAATRQNELETFVQQRTHGTKDIPESDILSFRENFAVLRSLYTPYENGVIDGNEEENEDLFGETLENGVEEDDNFVTQMELHELFDGVAGIEESLVSEEIVDGDMEVLKQQLERIQSLLGETRHQQARLNDISNQSTNLSSSQEVTLQKHMNDLEQLIHGIIRLMVAKVFELHAAIEKMVEVETVILNSHDFDAKLAESLEQSSLIEKTIRQLGPLDKEKNLDLELLKFLILQCYAIMHQFTIDFLNKTTDEALSPQKKSKLAELNRIWERQRPLIRSRERHLQSLELLPLPRKVEERAVVVENVESVQTPPAQTFRGETSKDGPSTPRDQRTPSPGRRRSPGQSGSPLDQKSPKTRQRQYKSELNDFADWLTSQEAVFHELAADETVPPDVEALGLRLKRFQTFFRSIQTRISRLEMFKEYAVQSDEGPMPANDSFNDVMQLANNMKEVCQENAEWISTVLLQWQSFEESKAKLTTWMDSLTQNLLAPLRELPEVSIDAVLLKVMKLRELDKKLNDKQSSRDALVYEGEQVLTATGNPEVQRLVSEVKERWRAVRQEAKDERQRLEKLLKLWREYQSGMDDLVDWLVTVLGFMRNEEVSGCSLDMVESQLENLKQYQADIESHQATKERLNQVVEELLQLTRGETNFLQESQVSLDENWTELWALLEDREQEILRHRADLMVVALFEDVADLDAWFTDMLRFAEEPAIPVGTNSMESAKKLLEKYKKILKELNSKREALDGLTTHVQELQGDRCDGPALEVRDAIRRLGMAGNQIANLLSEKERQIKHGISRWNEFQNLYAELKTINDWFETREEAMNKYQKIVSKKEFGIALEDVKAMKGFLVTQKQSVKNVLDYGKRLIGDPSVDQDELQESIETVEERWSELNTKVSEYEVWLESSLRAVEGYEAAVDHLNSFMDDIQEAMNASSSGTGDMEALRSRVRQLETFAGGLEGARGRLDEVTEVAAELVRNCDSSVSNHFEDNVIAVSERFSRISGQLQEKLKQQKDLLDTWQKFRSACAELVDWIEKQEALLAETVTINVPLNLQLQQLEICRAMEQEIDLHRESLSSINIMADKLKTKVTRSSTYILPLRTEVVKRFGELENELADKAARLNKATRSFMEMKRTVDELSSWLDKAEVTAESCSALEAEQSFEELEKLSSEADDSRSKLEALNRSIDEEVLGDSRDQTVGVNRQIYDLGKRCDGLKRRVKTKLDDNKKIAERRKAFESKYSLLYQMLVSIQLEEDSWKSGSSLNLKRIYAITDFHDNYERYRRELDQLTTLAEELDLERAMDSSYRSSLEEKLNKLRPLWKNACRQMEEYKEFLSGQTKKLEDFQRLCQQLLRWMEKIESQSGFSIPDCTSIHQMKEHYEHVKACQKEISSHRPEYQAVCSKGRQMVQQLTGSVAKTCDDEVENITRRWMLLTNRITSNQQHLKMSLKEWQEYSTQMENIMVWLREKDKILKKPSKATSVEELERELKSKKSIGKEFDERRLQLEDINKRGADLIKTADQRESERVNKQIASLSSLWQSVCHTLSTSMQSILDVIKQFETFTRLHEELSEWLGTVESSVSRDLEDSFLSGPDDQADTVFQVYVADIERHEAVRSRMNETAFHVISCGSGSPYTEHVAKKQQELNERWRALCQQLGVTYKKAEETKYELKLLEIQLKQLNAWMTQVENKLMTFTVGDTCEIAEVQQKHKELTEMQEDVERHSADVRTVLRLCERLERDRTACSTEEDRRVLRFTRESFESRWENVSKTAQTRKRQSEERSVLCKEFWNEFRKFVEWLDETEKALSTAISGRTGYGSPRSKLKVYESFRKDIVQHHAQIQRIASRSKYLIPDSRSQAVKRLQADVNSAKQRWECLSKKIQELVTKQTKVATRTERFESLKDSVTSFVTEVELSLIGLDPFTSEEEPKIQLNKLKNLQREINKNFPKLRAFLQEGKNLRDCCTTAQYQGVQNTMDELNSRWQKALHCCMSWILDIAIPGSSPSSSPPGVKSKTYRHHSSYT